jgi:hypothetical protein
VRSANKDEDTLVTLLRERTVFGKNELRAGVRPFARDATAGPGLDGAGDDGGVGEGGTGGIFDEGSGTSIASES